MTFRPPWKSPPPDLYKLKPVLGYRNHDITKKRAPAWSFVRYIPRPKPKPEVSPSPFQLSMKKKKFGKKKRAQDMKQGKYDFITDGGVSKKKMQHRRKKHKNKNRTNLEESKLTFNKKLPQDGPSSKDKSKKISGNVSADSGRFFVSPADMCDLCFPWMKKQDKTSEKQDDPKIKKVRRSRSFSLFEEESAPQRHSFIVIPRTQGRGDATAEKVCEPHSGTLLPSGHKTAFTSTKHALPRPPQDDEESESIVPQRTTPKKKKSPKNLDHVMASG